jgi:hypothetical protein
MACEPLALLDPYLEALLEIEPVNALVIDMPPLPSQ